MTKYSPSVRGIYLFSESELSGCLGCQCCVRTADVLQSNPWTSAPTMLERFLVYPAFSLGGDCTAGGEGHKVLLTVTTATHSSIKVWKDLQQWRFN